MCSKMNGKKFVKDERMHVPQLLHIDSDTITVRLFPHYYEEEAVKSECCRHHTSAARESQPHQNGQGFINLATH